MDVKKYNIMLLPKLLVELDDLKQEYIKGTISEADFMRLRNARRQQFREEEKANFEGQEEEISQFFRDCRLTGKVRKGR